MTQTPAPEPIGSADWGFDIIISNGQSYIAGQEDDDDDTQMGGPTPPYWNRVQCDILDEAIPLNGFRYSMRYWVSFETTESDDADYNKSAIWELLSQTIEVVDPTPPIFMSNIGDELFPMEPGDGTDLSNKGGIKDGTRYDYLSVFDEAELSWLPRASVYDQEFIDQRYLPQVDETDNRLPDPQLSIDTISAFVPDPRLEVPVTYRVRTTFRAPAFQVIPGVYDPASDSWSEPSLDIGDSGNRDEWVTRNYSFTITQICFQNLDDIVEKLHKVLDAAYFTHGYNHIQLYELNASPNYDEDANPIGPVLQPLYEKDEHRTEMVGFDVFRLLNTVADESTIDEAEVLATEEARKEQVEEMTAAIKPLIEESQKQVAKDEEDIAKAQKEYAEEIKLNEERQDKLINNMLKQMNLETDQLNSGGESQYTFESLMEMIVSKRNNPTPQVEDEE